MSQRGGFHGARRDAARVSMAIELEEERESGRLSTELL